MSAPSREVFRLRSRRRLSALEVVLLIVINIALVTPLLMTLQPPVVGEEPSPARLVIYLVGLAVILVQFAEIVRPGTFGRKRVTCTLGGDGLQTPTRFIPWSHVRQFRGPDTLDIGPQHKPPYGAGQKNIVAVVLERDVECVWVEDPQVVIDSAERLRGLYETRRDAKIADDVGYRERVIAPEQLVRIVLDGSSELSKRADAFARLNAEERGPSSRKHRRQSSPQTAGAVKPDEHDR